MDTIARQRGIQIGDVINMDETGVWFDMSSTRSVETVGARQVPIRRVKNSKTRMIAVISITAGGRVLKPFLIFRGQRMTRELSAIDQNHLRILVQQNAWMDTNCMARYCEDLVEEFGTVRPKLLIMDSFIVHRNHDCLQMLTAANFSVLFIPTGFTDVCQHLDVAFFAGFKSRMRSVFQDWVSNLYDDFRWDGSPPSNHSFADGYKKQCQLLPLNLFLSRSLPVVSSKVDYSG